MVQSFYSTLDVEERIETLVYDAGNFLAAAGGNLGLLLGFSCLSTVFGFINIIQEYFTHWTCFSLIWFFVLIRLIFFQGSPLQILLKFYSVFTATLEIIQWTPLNGITLGQTITDPFNRMIPITEHMSYKRMLWEVFGTWSIWVILIPLFKWSL